MVKVFAGRFSRAERCRRRAHVDLEDAALSEKTKTRYYLALRKLLPYVEKSQHVADLDIWICKWIRSCWRHGEPLLTIGDGLSALHFYQPWTRRQIPHSWKLFSVWRRVEIPARAPPLTQRLVRSLAAYEMARNNLEMATCLLLGFHCLLRTGELLQLTCQDFMLGPTSGICALRFTKSGRRNAAQEAISITDLLTLEVLRQLLIFRKDTASDALPIWSASGSCFRLRFRTLMTLFSLQEHNFKPYSLRRGGATHVFQTSKSMEVALERGRWNCSRTAKIYISDALSYIPTIRMHDSTRHMCRSFFFFNPQEG